MARVRTNSALLSIISDCREALLLTEGETFQIEKDLIGGSLTVSALKIIQTACKKLPGKPSLRQALLSSGKAQQALVLGEKPSDPEIKTVSTWLFEKIKLNK